MKLFKPIFFSLAALCAVLFSTSPPASARDGGTVIIMAYHAPSLPVLSALPNLPAAVERSVLARCSADLARSAARELDFGRPSQVTVTTTRIGGAVFRLPRPV